MLDRNRFAATAPRRAAAARAPRFQASTVALAAALVAASPHAARAANECGTLAAGGGSITCAGASYPAGITYDYGDDLTFILDNPAMAIGGTGLTVTNPTPSLDTRHLAVHARNVGSISASNTAITVLNRRNLGSVAFTMDGGLVSSNSATRAVLVQGLGWTAAEMTLNGGRIVNTGAGEGILIQTGGTTAGGDMALTITGGSVEAVASAARVFVPGNTANMARIRMSGGSVLSTNANGLFVHHRGNGLARLEMIGGTATATGNNGDGVLVTNRFGTYAVELTGGTVTGGSGFGAAVHVSAAAGGTVNIGAGAVLQAASGVALRDGDENRDGIDEIGGSAAITTAGTLHGAIVLGGGTDSVTVTGGAIHGNIVGDGSDRLAFDLGSGRFIYGAAYTLSGIERIAMNSGTAQIDSAIAGPTAVEVHGGKLVLTAANTYTGATTVAGGTLQLGTSAAPASIAGNVDVFAGGRLQGTGSVGNLSVAGTVAPGHSIGTLNVNGNFTQAGGSVYQVEVDPASSASDLIHASGSASIASGARLNVVRTASSEFVAGRRYTVLTADGGVTGTYSLTGDTQTAFVQLRDSYDANHVYVSPEKVRSFTEAAGTPNQVAVATALESLPDSNGLVHAVNWLPNDFAARDAFNQLSVDIHASTKAAMLEDSRFVREAAIDRLRSATCAPGSASASPQQAGEDCMPEGQQRTAWGQVFGSWGHIDGNANAAKLKRDIGGFVVGADTGVGAGWRVGALGGYSRASADTEARNSSAKTDSYHLGLYGGTQWGATSLRLGASRTWNKTDASRAVAFAGFADAVSAKYDSGTTQLFGEVGHRIDAGAVALEPFAGLAHVRVKSDAFFERGGLAALYGDGGSVDATFSTLGVRASTQLSDNTRLRGLLGWRHAFGDTTPTSTHAFGGSLPFTIAGVPLAKNVAVLEAGVETQLRPSLTLGASYAGQFGDGLRDHGFKVHLNWAF